MLPSDFSVYCFQNSHYYYYYYYLTSFHWPDLYIFLLSLLFSVFWEISLITSSILFKGEKTLLIIECVYVCFAYCCILNGCNSALHTVENFCKMLKWIYECYHILLTSWMFLFLASYFCFLKILIFFIIMIINVWGFSCNTLYSLLLLSFLFVCLFFICLPIFHIESFLHMAGDLWLSNQWVTKVFCVPGQARVPSFTLSYLVLDVSLEQPEWSTSVNLFFSGCFSNV